MDFVDTLFGFFEFLGQVNFSVIFSVFGVGLAMFWIVIIGWTWSDALARYRSRGAALMIVILLVVFNIFGLLIYLVIRPRYTLEDEYWEDLERRFLRYEAQGLGDCPHCGTEVQPSYIYCTNCGKSLRVKCKECEMYLEPSWKVCPFCGKRQKVARKKQIKGPEVSNIDTIPNVGILRFGKRIDEFFRRIGGLIRPSAQPKKNSENKKTKK